MADGTSPNYSLIDLQEDNGLAMISTEFLLQDILTKIAYPVSTWVVPIVMGE